VLVDERLNRQRAPGRQDRCAEERAIEGHHDSTEQLISFRNHWRRGAVGVRLQEGATRRARGLPGVNAA
jgi:hypothetical protein